MPVVVTGAGGLIGRALLRRLAGGGGEIRALVRAPADREALRPLVPKTAVADLEDVEALETLLHDAHTVIHLAGGIDLPDEAAYERANHATVACTVEAAEVAGVRRFILLSYPGASPEASNAYLRAKGRAERALVGSAVPERLVIRSTHVFGPNAPWLEAMRRVARAPIAIVPGSGGQRIAPVFVEDVAAVLAAADDRGSTVDGTFGLEGPEVLTLDGFIDRLAGRRRRALHVPPGRAAGLARLAGRPLSAAMLEVLAADSRADAPDAAAELGVPLTPLDEGLARG